MYLIYVSIFEEEGVGSPIWERRCEGFCSDVKTMDMHRQIVDIRNKLWISKRIMDVHGQITNENDENYGWN